MAKNQPNPSPFVSFEEVRQRIKAAIEKSGLSFIDIAEQTGIDRNTIRAVVEGRIKDPGIGKILRLLSFLGLDCTVLAPEYAGGSRIQEILTLIEQEPLLNADHKRILKSYLKKIMQKTAYRFSRILLVDDQEMYLTALEALLSKRGYQIQKALTYDQAVAALTSFEPELAIVDLNLDEDKSGLDVLRHFQQYSPATYCVMLSASRNQKLSHQAIQEGAFDYVDKVDDPEKLFFVIRKIEDYDFLRKSTLDLKSLIQG